MELWLELLKRTNDGKETKFITIDQYQDLAEIDMNETYYITAEKTNLIIPPKFSFTFDGANFKDLLTVEKVNRSFASPTVNHLIENDYSDGAIFIGSRREPLYIEVEFNYVQENLSAIRRVLSRMLVTDYLGELWFSDEPDIFYYAKLDGQIDLEEGYRHAKGKMTFIIPDAVGYSVKHTTRTFNNIGSVFLENWGSDYAYPVFDFTLKSLTYMIALTTATATYQFGQTLEDSPQKEVAYSLDPVEGYLPIRKSAVTIDNEMSTAPPAGWTYYDISNLREEWASTGGRYKVTSFTPVGPINGKVKIGQHAVLWQTGEKIPTHLKGKTFTVTNTKNINQSRSTKAYELKDGSKYLGWLLEQDIDNQNAIKGGIEAVYGTAVPRKWYGPSIIKEVKGTPSNWQLDVRSSFKLAKHSEYGMQYMAVLSGTDVLFSYEITSNKLNRTASSYLVANNRGISFTQDPGGYFMKDFEGLITVNFMDDRLTLEIRNTINNKMIAQSWRVPDLQGRTATQVVIFTSRYPDKPVPDKNFFNYIKFTGFDTEVWISPDDEYNVNGVDPQHVFKPGDVVRLDMNDMKAYVNGLPMLTPVAHGSKACRIPPGVHEVIVSTEETGEKPTLEVNYRERWK